VGHTLSEPDQDNSPQPRYSRYWQHALGSCRRAVTTREHELIITFRWSFGNCKAIDGSCDNRTDLSLSLRLTHDACTDLFRAVNYPQLRHQVADLILGNWGDSAWYANRSGSCK
jgi:hypothetical protein